MNSFYPPFQKIIKIGNFKIVDVKIELFISASFTAMLFDMDGNHYDNRVYKLTEPEYVLWGSDDNYLVKYVKDALKKESETV
jgi:hypothetical protein